MTESSMPAPLRTLVRRAAAATGLALAVALVAGCGGTTQIDPFEPNSLHIFGDELALLEADGHRHGINGVATTTTTNPDGSTTSTSSFSCSVLPVWTQSLTNAFGLAAAPCPGSATTFKASYHAAAGAKVADLVTQLAAQSGVLVANDMVAIHIGLNDIVDIYDTRVAGQADHASALSAALTEARSRGTTVATQVRSLIDRGVKVVLVTPPDLGYSPWARALGSTAMTDISQIANELSLGIRLPVGQLDARDVIVAAGTDIVLSYVNSANNGGTANVTTAACPGSAPLTACLSNALVTGTSHTTHLWAGDKIPGWLFHSSAATDLLRLAVYF